MAQKSPRQNHLCDTGITLTMLGFGTGNYSEASMEQVANHGNGNYAHIDSALEAKKVLGDEMASTLVTMAKDVKVQVEFNPAVVNQYLLAGPQDDFWQQEFIRLANLAGSLRGN